MTKIDRALDATKRHESSHSKQQFGKVQFKLLHRCRIQKRRLEIALNACKGERAYEQGTVKYGSVDDLFADLYK